MNITLEFHDKNIYKTKLCVGWLNDLNLCGELGTLELLRAEAVSNRRLGGSRTPSVPRIHNLKRKPKERTEGNVILTINIIKQEGDPMPL